MRKEVTALPSKQILRFYVPPKLNSKKWFLNPGMSLENAFFELLPSLIVFAPFSQEQAACDAKLTINLNCTHKIKTK